MSPLLDQSPLERLRASGQVDEAAVDLETLPEPVVLPAGSEPASVTLARLRRTER